MKIYTYDREATIDEIRDYLREPGSQELRFVETFQTCLTDMITVQEELSLVEALLHPVASVRADAKRNAK